MILNLKRYLSLLLVLMLLIGIVPTAYLLILQIIQNICRFVSLSR